MHIESIAISNRKGIPKKPVESAYLIRDHGIKGDAHAGKWRRQVSFLSAESIEKAHERGLDVGFGGFAENIATSGIDWPSLPLGTRIQIGETALVEISQIGKKCHKGCAIFEMTGDCIMRREGVFARVLKGGKICRNDEIHILKSSKTSWNRELGVQYLGACKKLNNVRAPKGKEKETCVHK